MSTPLLPDPIAAYFAADAQGPEAVARCFAPAGVVEDEQHTYVGRSAIQAWKAQASSRYAYTTQPLRAEKQGKEYLVLGRVSGNFPGSPIDLQYRFRLEAGLVSHLEITQ